MAPSIQDMGLRHDGRVLVFTVVVNTHEDVAEVMMRVQKAARGQHRAAVMCSAALHTGENGKQVWQATQQLAKEIAANPKSVEVDDEGKPSG